jgi:hypothetical protein
LFTRRDYLIYNYEDRFLDNVFTDRFETEHDRWIGSSAKRYDVLVIRDPFNTFASRVSASWIRYKLDDKAGKETSIRLWKSYAREAMGDTNFARHNRIVINYNRWFTEVEYRRKLSARLGLAFSDAGFGAVSGEYGGSSFDGVRYNGDAQQMQVLDRWKLVANNSVYKELFNDQELLALSYRLFGDLPGTTELLQLEG